MERNVMDMTLREAHRAMWEWIASEEGQDALCDNDGLYEVKKMWLEGHGMEGEYLDFFCYAHEACFLCFMYRPEHFEYVHAKDTPYCPAGSEYNVCALCPDCPLKTCSFGVYSPFRVAENGEIWEFLAGPEETKGAGACAYIAEHGIDKAGRFPPDMLVGEAVREAYEDWVLLAGEE